MWWNLRGPNARLKRLQVVPGSPERFPVVESFWIVLTEVWPRLCSGIVYENQAEYLPLSNDGAYDSVWASLPPIPLSLDMMRVLW